MSTSTSNLWLTSEFHSGLVSIGTHSLHLKTSGPPRRPGDPVAVIVQGLTSNASSWAAVSRLLSPQVRTYTYSRSGYTPSESSPLPPKSENIALELDLLLQAADIESPYVLVGHSWGGILAREFIARRKEGEVVGVVFVETNQESTLEILDWRPFFLWAFGANVDTMKIFDLEKRKALNDEEWKALLKDMAHARNQQQGNNEMAEYEDSFETLRKKEQLGGKLLLLGNYPVSIVKGENAQWLKKLYDAIIQTGYGTEEDNKWFTEYLSTFEEKDIGLQFSLGELSSNSRFVNARKSGHDVQLTEPEIIVEEVKWAVGQYFQKEK